jgi:hypothetical protein
MEIQIPYDHDHDGPRYTNKKTLKICIYLKYIFVVVCKFSQAASDKVYQLLAHGRWFSPGIPTSSTTKTGRHDIAEILLKVALNTINLNL